MRCDKLRSKDLPGLNEMPYICTAEITAGITAAALLNRAEIMGIDGVTNHHLAIRGHHCAVTGNAAVMYYLPALLISGIVTGLFTGMCTYYILKNKYVKRICAALAEDR